MIRNGKGMRRDGRVLKGTSGMGCEGTDMGWIRVGDGKGLECNGKGQGKDGMNRVREGKGGDRKERGGDGMGRDRDRMG